MTIVTGNESPDVDARSRDDVSVSSIKDMVLPSTAADEGRSLHSVLKRISNLVALKEVRLLEKHSINLGQAAVFEQEGYREIILHRCVRDADSRTKQPQTMATSTGEQAIFLFLALLVLENVRGNSSAAIAFHIVLLISRTLHLTKTRT